MPSLRSIRLLNSVEGGTTSGAELEEFLSEPNGGRLAEFKVLLSMRGQARRIAASPNTITAIIASPTATLSVFELASPQSSATAFAITESAAAMSAICLSVSAITAIFANPTSKGHFVISPNLSNPNAKNAIAVLAGLVPGTFANIENLIADAQSRAAVIDSDKAMNVLVSNNAAVQAIANSATAIDAITNDVSSLDILITSENAMSIISTSDIAMNELKLSASAVAKIAATPLAIKAVFSQEDAWEIFKSSSYFADNAAKVIVNLAGLTGTFTTVNGIINNASALTLVAGNAGAMQALAAVPAALTYLAESPNFSIIANSGSAMALLTPTSAMASFFANADALAAIFDSSGAKSAVFSSSNSLAALKANESALDYLGTIASSTFSTTVPNSAGAQFKPFGGGVPAKVLILRVRQAGIGAIPAGYQFQSGGGAPSFGADKLNVVNVAGVAALSPVYGGLSHVAAYSDLEYDCVTPGVIAITAAPGIQYVDMT
jgi:hypothetical protein